MTNQNRNSFSEINNSFYIKKHQKLIGSTTYILMTQLDALYPDNLHISTNSQFQYFLHNTICNLNWLLYFHEKDFFTELQSSNLPLSLESFLCCFSRKQYTKRIIIEEEEYDAHNYLSSIQHIDQKYDLLMKLVLFLIYRISVTSNYKQKLYDNWLLDIPKLFDLCAIYGENNPMIVKQIIKNTFRSNYEYQQDMQDIFYIIYKNIFPKMKLQLQFVPNLELKNQQYQHYGNLSLSLTRNTMKTIFRFLDCYQNIFFVYLYFQSKIQIKLATHVDIQQQLAIIYDLFITKVDQQWKLGQSQSKMRPIIVGIQEIYYKFLIRTFDYFYEIMIQKSHKANIKDTIQTYMLFCQLYCSNNYKHVKNMLHLIMKDTPVHLIFCLKEEHFKTQILLSEIQQNLLKKSYKKQETYRQNLLNQYDEDFDIIQIQLNNIPSYKNWKSGYTFDIFDPNQTQIKLQNKAHSKYDPQYDDEPTNNLFQFDPWVRLNNEYDDIPIQDEDRFLKKLNIKINNQQIQELSTDKNSREISMIGNSALNQINLSLVGQSIIDKSDIYHNEQSIEFMNRKNFQREDNKDFPNRDIKIEQNQQLSLQLNSFLDYKTQNMSIQIQ